MVMEYLEGSDLSGWLKQRGMLPVEQAADFVLQACVAVADAHALGIVHRDLKPANLFCVRRSDGQLSIKVLDFGISKLNDGTGAGAMAMTKTSALMGSPLYMSPEQMRSARDVDARTDIWALGIILCELVTGRPPFMAESVTELAIRVASEPPPPLRNLRPDLPDGLEALVFKCLEKDRARRYQNVGELAVALLPFASRRGSVSVERIGGILEAAGMGTGALPNHESTLSASSSGATRIPTNTLPAVGRTTLGTKRGKSALLGAGLVGVLALGGGVTFLLMSPKATTSHDEAHAAGPPSAVVSATPPVAAVPTPPPVETKPAEPVPPPAVAPSPVPVAPMPAPVPRTVTVSRPFTVPRAAPPPANAAPAAPPPAAKPVVNCDPPYYFDARGNRAYKPECL
jgi:serine/threonine protein kinase